MEDMDDDEGIQSDFERDGTVRHRSNRADVSESDDDDDSATTGSVAGSLARYQPLEAEKIDLENAVFVLLGVFLVGGLIVAGITGF